MLVARSALRYLAARARVVFGLEKIPGRRLPHPALVSLINPDIEAASGRIGEKTVKDPARGEALKLVAHELLLQLPRDRLEAHFVLNCMRAHVFELYAERHLEEIMRQNSEFHDSNIVAVDFAQGKRN